MAGTFLNPVKDFNVLLLVCDTLRMDTSPLYGGIANMPALDILARDSMIFRNCYSPSPWTLPSHISMMTGLYPKEHKVFERVGSSTADLAKIIEEYTGFWLPSFFKSQGFNSFGISGNSVVSRYTGFDKGFDNFVSADFFDFSPIDKSIKSNGESIISRSETLWRLLRTDERRSVQKYIKAWNLSHKYNALEDYPRNKGGRLITELLENTRIRPNFFLFLNLLEMHEPYLGETKRERFDHHYGIKLMTKKRADKLFRQYIKEAEILDSYIGKIIHTLKERNLYENTLIILTSDHGQAFLEHDFLYHGSFLYNEITSVPLVVKPPKGVRLVSGKKVQSLVNIPKVMKSIFETNELSTFDSEYALSESHSNEWVFPQRYKMMQDYVNNRYEVSRFAVMKDNTKLSIRGREYVVEEFLVDGKRAIPTEQRNAFTALTSLLENYMKDHPALA